MYNADLFSASNVPVLRDYQEAAATAAIKYMRDTGGNPIVCAATGTGKSVIIGSIIARVIKANPGARIMCATHVAELLVQNAEKIKAMVPGADVGFYSAGLGKKDTANQIIFAGIQSVYRADVGLVNLLIVDEVHTISKKDKSMWASLIATLKKHNPRLMIVGLSATPFRLDSGSLVANEDSLFHDIVYDYGLGRAISDGWLCPLTTKYTKTTFDISGVGKVGGEYNLKELEAATNIDASNRAAVAEMVERGVGRKSWLVFCNGVAHSFAIRDEIRRHGIVCETVTGETPDDERDRILREFKEGKIRAVTNNAVWTTGIDVPGVDLIGMLRHTMSGGLLLQMAGRGTRTITPMTQATPKERREAIAVSDKPNCLFLDFARNIERHGFLDTIKAKEKGAKKDGVAPMKACPDCFTICHAAAKSCKDCGYEFPKNEAALLEGAYDGAVLSGPQTKDVIDVEYRAHISHKNKKELLKVIYYHPDGTDTTDWVCLKYEGGAGYRADKWWQERDTLGTDYREFATIAELVEGGYCKYLKRPQAITIIRDNGYNRPKAYHNLSLIYSKPSNTFVDDAEIVW